MNQGKFPWRMKVVAHRPMRNAAFACVLAVAIAFAGYWLGIHHAERVGPRERLVDNSSAPERVVDLERKLADMRLSQRVDGEANESLRQTIKSLRDQLSASQEEVLFYRQLMAPSEAQRGLRIEKLELTPGATDTEVRYRLLLTQVADRPDWINGVINVDIVGTSANEQVVLPLTEMSQVDTYPLAFKLRYFQEFTGTLVIPDGMKPEQVVVSAAMAGKGAKRVQKTFSWTLEEE